MVSAIGKLFKDDKQERKARMATLDFKILQQSFLLMGGFIMIASFVFSDLITTVSSTFNEFYQKDFYIHDA